MSSPQYEAEWPIIASRASELKSDDIKKLGVLIRVLEVPTIRLAEDEISCFVSGSKANVYDLLHVLVNLGIIETKNHHNPPEDNSEADQARA